jgi:glycosyltransferase involved in cell wall biosynthesis
MRLKMFLLRMSQGRSFQSTDGLIFLSNYARTRLCSRLGLDIQRTALIPHGIEERFFCAPRSARGTADYSAAKPFRLLYVSILMPYKHQLEVGRAVARLRDSGLAVSVDFAGDLWGNYGKAVEKEFRRIDPQQSFLKLLGSVPFEQLHALYAEADAFVFASSCENLPNILIEAMASGLPVLSSNRGPMPEVLGDAGWYFDPYSATSIADAIAKAMQDPASRQLRAMRSFEKVRQYSWSRCASDTFSFIAKVAKERGV